MRSIPACAGKPFAFSLLSHVGLVYPRVRGGTCLSDQQSRARMGLSPRARGNQCKKPTGRRGYRSIPACAGEPSILTPLLDRFKVYPRVRGGTQKALLEAFPGAGLSPRARGNPAGSAGETHNSGSIPACAGEPAAPAPAVRRLAVYPRVRGGTRERVQMSLEQRGLSPRARGNLMRSCLRREMLGSIPACAGEPPP